jgi:hypothetical protein
VAENAISSADNDHMGLDLVIAEDSSPAATPLSVDFAMLNAAGSLTKPNTRRSP